MIKNSKTIFALLVLPLLAFASDSSQIRESYDNLDKAILAQDGPEALSQMSQESRDYIEEVRKLALSADKASLIEKPISTILTVFSIRKEAEGTVPADAAETLVLMSGDYAQVSSLVSIGEITVDGDKASAQMIMNGSPSQITYAFVKENGQWKTDLIAQMAATEEMMMSTMQGSGATRETLINQMAAASQTKDLDVWEPLQ